MNMDLTENLRQTILMVIAILALICFFSSFLLFICAAYIKVKVDARMKLIETYNSNVLPAIFVFVGVINLVQNIFCLFICLKLRNVDNREGQMKMLMPVLIGGIVLVVFEFSSAIASFVHISILNDEFGTGIRNAMKEYVKGGELKVEMDLVQTHYGCCGDEDYTDWFLYSWLDPVYLNVAHGAAKKYFNRDGKYYSDDTPFSCCDMHSPRPCIHHHIHDNTRHHNYNYMVETTLYVRGCRLVLMDIYSDVLCTVAGIAMLIATVKITLLLLFRLVQTSLLEAQLQDDWEATTPGYIYYLKPPDADMEKKMQESGSESPGDMNASSTSERDTGNESGDTTESTTDEESSNTEGDSDVNKNYSSSTSVQENSKEKKNQSNQIRPRLSAKPSVPESIFDKNTSHKAEHEDRLVQSSTLKQSWAVQNSYFMPHDERNNNGNYYSVSYENFNPGRTSSGHESERVLDVGVQNVPDNPSHLPSKVLESTSEHTKDKVFKRATEISAQRKQLVKSKDEINKQVKFMSKHSKLAEGGRAIAQEICSRLSGKVKLYKGYGTDSQKYKYSLLTSSSDCEEEHEEDDSCEEEEEEDDDDDENESSSEADTVIQKSCTQIQNIPPTKPMKNVECSRDDYLAAETTEDDNREVDMRNKKEMTMTRLRKPFSASENMRYSQGSGQQERAHTPNENIQNRRSRDKRNEEKANITSRHRPHYQEENEDDPANDSKSQNSKWKTSRKPQNDQTEALPSLATRDYVPRRQTKVMAPVLESAKTTTGVETYLAKSQLFDEWLLTDLNRTSARRPKQETAPCFSDQSSSDISPTPDNSFFSSKASQQQTDGHRFSTSHSTFYETWPQNRRPGEMANQSQISDTEHESSNTDQNDQKSDHSRRFPGRYTPYPCQVFRYERGYSEEYDFIPTNIRQTTTSTAHSLPKHLIEGRNDSSDVCELNTEVPESDVEVAHITSTSSEDARPLHVMRSRIKESHSRQRTLEASSIWQPGQIAANETAGAKFPASGERLSSARECPPTVPDKRKQSCKEKAAPQVQIPLQTFTTNSFAFPTLLHSPSTFQMGGPTMNHVRSYQRRSIFISSPVSSSDAGSPSNPRSPHLALLSSPFAASPMETSTPIICAQRAWDSVRRDTFTTSSNVTESSPETEQVRNMDKPAPNFAEKEAAMPSSCPRTKQTSVPTAAEGRQAAASEKRGQTTPGQGKWEALLDLTPTRSEHRRHDDDNDGDDDSTSACQSRPQNRVLISPFN